LPEGGSIWDLLTIIVVLGVVFWLAWFVTRFIAVRSKGKTSGRFMRVVDRLSISNDKAILIVKIGAEYSIIGVAGHEMSLLGKLDAEQAEAFEQEAPAGVQKGAAGNAWKGMQSFGARLAMAIRGRSIPSSQPLPEENKKQDGQSVLDMMDERIKLRKETKR
jgi:flagellar biosynthetic protein FliO